MPSAPYKLARGGPYLRNRLPLERKLDEGREVFAHHVLGETPIRQIAAQLGMSPTTAWRRSWFYIDTVWWPAQRNLPRDHVPPQRGTRACPAGEPPLLDRDAAPRRIRHPLPAARCQGRRRRDGGPCGRWALRGATVCPGHGATTPQVRKAAGDRVATAETVDRVLRKHIRHPDLRVQDLRARVIAARDQPAGPHGRAPSHPTPWK